MAADTAQSTLLLAKLESLQTSHSQYDDIFSLFADHLRPFSDLANSAKTKRPSKSAAVHQQQASIRALAKQYLSFLNRSLSVLPKLLSASRPDQSQLFQTFKLCLDCLDLLSPQLACKPYSVCIQRLRCVRCLVSCGLYADTMGDGFRLLESLRGMSLGGGTKGKIRARLLPAAKEANEDKEFAVLVVETVATLVKCVAMGQSRDSGDYLKVLGLVEEVGPWFRELDANASEKFHRGLSTCLGKCTLFLVGDLIRFDVDLVRSFCTATFVEYARSSSSDELFKFARRVCSILFSSSERGTLLILDVLTCLLDSMDHDGKVERESTGREFLELISYCANKCRSASASFYCELAVYINDIASEKVSTPVNLILKIYALGLYTLDRKVKFRDGGSTTSNPEDDGSAISKFVVSGDHLKPLPSLLNSLRGCFHIEPKVTCLAPNDQYKDSRGHSCCKTYGGFDASIMYKEKGEEDYALAYMNALKFLCLPLSELVNSGRKSIVGGSDLGSAFVLHAIQDALDHFCDVFVCYWSTSYRLERDRFEEHVNAVPGVVTAAFTLSFTTKLNLQKNMHVIDYVIGSEWIQLQGLKFLFVALHNLSVSLCRAKQVKEASEALKLSCRASWTYVIHICKLSEQRTSELGNLFEDVTANINEACARSAFYLDVLYQCGSERIEKECLCDLKNWSIARNLVPGLPSPSPLLKQWAKIQCKQHKNVDVVDGLPVLCQLLLSSKEVPEESHGIIAEQELLAYEEVTSLNPELSNAMQIKIINSLLQEHYVTQASFQKARLLIKKGRILKSCGTKGLDGCIKCLSDAISTFGNIGGQSCFAVAERHLLASAYFLRALCTQEAEPKSKRVLEDTTAALNLLTVGISDNNTVDEANGMIPVISLPLLYNILDLLLLKFQGCTSLHYQLFRLMIMYFRLKNIEQEKYLALLWESRRMTHALCFTPISETFITVLSEQCGENSKSMNHWMHCLKESETLLVGFKNVLSFLITGYPRETCQEEVNYPLYIRGDQVKEAALGLISSVSLPSRSLFVAGHLFYDLSERLIWRGRLQEALSFAKESHAIRTKLFQEKFTYSIEQQAQKHSDSEEFAQKCSCSIANLRVSRMTAEVWSFSPSTIDSEAFYLSPWNVMQVYLESTLQVGTIHELIGNGTEAETLLLWGKSISCVQDLPQLTGAFSSVLGKIYRRKRCWDLANMELQTARQIFADSGTSFSCSKCRLLLEAAINLQFGDLVRARSDTTSYVSEDELSHAEELYKSALDRLAIECRNPIDSSNYLNGRCVPVKDRPTGKVESKNRNSKSVAKFSTKDHIAISDGNKRLTRSRYRSVNQGTSLPTDARVDPSAFLASSHASVCNENSDNGELLSHTETPTIGSSTGVLCICKGMKCWHCLPFEVMKSGSLSNFIYTRWEFYCRRLSSRLLTGIGRCRGTCGQMHKTHEILLESISNVMSRNIFSQCSVPVPLMLDLVSKQMPHDALGVERAVVLYNICWFALNNYGIQDKRIKCCELSCIQLPQIAAWLKVAFLLCHDVPTLMRKVSQLLALTCILSAKSGTCLSSDALSENHWASFFHQASLGAHVNQLFTFNMVKKCKVHAMMDGEGQMSGVRGSTCFKEELYKNLGIPPESVHDLEDIVRSFFSCLPCATVICMSVVSGSDAKLLQEVLVYPSYIRAWLLVSRLNCGSQPIVVLLPLDPLLEDAFDDYCNSSYEVSSGSDKCFEKRWNCPWGFSVVDDIVPGFKGILEENYLSCSLHSLEDTKENRLLWWKRRKNLDLRLGKLLGKLEESWLGSWKCLLLGALLNTKHLDSVLRKLMRDLRSKCHMDIDMGLIKILLGGLQLGSGQACIPQLQSNHTCYIGEGNEVPSSECVEAGEQSEKAVQFIQEAIKQLEKEDCLHREPVILVLDCEVQMLPWENIPVLRNQEVYRMPSVRSIFMALDRNGQCEEQVGSVLASFPCIDPLDAFYLLNPSGDLSSTQVEFENWFRDQKLEGNVGCAPPPAELALALNSHDLFIYFGHGSGVQYIPRHEIQKLDRCAATLLMGCSSGCLILHGAYVPEGASLSYLLAGSPVIIANLWEVTDKDIDRFGKAMLDAWLRERSNSIGCAPCSSLTSNFEAMDLNKSRGPAKQKLTRKKSPESSNAKTCEGICHRKAMVGSFMGQAREACTLPFLIGASPVCYGVPTGIRRKKDL